MTLSELTYEISQSVLTRKPVPLSTLTEKTAFYEACRRNSVTGTARKSGAGWLGYVTGKLPELPSHETSQPVSPLGPALRLGFLPEAPVSRSGTALLRYLRSATATPGWPLSWHALCTHYNCVVQPAWSQRPAQWLARPDSPRDSLTPWACTPDGEKLPLAATLARGCFAPMFGTALLREPDSDLIGIAKLALGDEPEHVLTKALDEVAREVAEASKRD